MCEPRKRMQLMLHSAAVSPRPHPATGEYRSPPVGGHHRQARRIAFGSYGPTPSASLAGCGVGTWRGETTDRSRPRRADRALCVHGGSGQPAGQCPSTPRGPSSDLRLLLPHPSDYLAPRHGSKGPASLGGHSCSLQLEERLDSPASSDVDYRRGPPAEAKYSSSPGWAVGE
jgi:hypothetical protein